MGTGPATPRSVNARDNFRRLPCPPLEVASCDIEIDPSRPVSRRGLRHEGQQGQARQGLGSTRPSSFSSTRPYQLPLQLPFLQLLEQQSLSELHGALLPPHVTH